MEGQVAKSFKMLGRRFKGILGKKHEADDNDLKLSAWNDGGNTINQQLQIGNEYSLEGIICRDVGKEHIKTLYWEPKGFLCVIISIP